jgi:hypothetical protein
MYGYASLMIDRQSESKTLAAEMWFLRSMLRLSYKEHKTNCQVLCKTNTDRKLLNEIKQRQCTFIGHGMHGEGMENLLVKFQGKETDVDKEKISLMAFVIQMAECKTQQRHIQGCA